MDEQLKGDMKKYAAIGAVGSLFVPFVGPVLGGAAQGSGDAKHRWKGRGGAVAGAGYAAYKAAQKK